MTYLLYFFLLILTPQENTKYNLKTKLEAAHYSASDSLWKALKKETKRALKNSEKDHHYHYYMAHIYYNLANYFMKTDDDKADDLLDDAIDHLDESIDIKESADAYVLYSLVIGRKISISPFKAFYLGPRLVSKIDNAYNLQANNPRVKIADAVGKMYQPELFGGDKDKARELLKEAIVEYDQFVEPDTMMILWSKADAYAWLANLDIIEEKKSEALIHAQRAKSLQNSYDFVDDVLMPLIAKLPNQK